MLSSSNSSSMEEKSWSRSTSNLYIFQLHSITMLLTNTSLDQLMVATLLYRLCEPIFQLNWVTVTYHYYERPSCLSVDTHIIVMIGLVQLYILSVASAGLVFLSDQKSPGMVSSCHPVSNIPSNRDHVRDETATLATYQHCRKLIVPGL